MINSHYLILILEAFQKNIEKVQHFLEGLHYKFTILTFTETWLAKYNSSLPNFIGYSHVYKLRDKNVGEVVCQCSLIAE